MLHVAAAAIAQDSDPDHDSTTAALGGECAAPHFLISKNPVFFTSAIGRATLLYTSPTSPEVTMKPVAVVPAQPADPVSADKTTGGTAVTAPIAPPAAPQPSGSPVQPGGQ